MAMHLPGLAAVLVLSATAALAQEEPPMANEAMSGIMRFARDELYRHLEGHAVLVELTPAGRETNTRCVQAHFLSAEVAPAGGLAPRMLSAVRIRCEDGRMDTVPVWFDVKAYDLAVVAARDLPPGSVLKPGDVETVELDITQVRGEPWPAGKAVTGLHTVVPVRAGAPITRAMLGMEPEVVAQTPVLIRARHGTVKVEAVGLALQDGRVGDRVQVLNLSSGDTIMARVTHSGAVEAFQ